MKKIVSLLIGLIVVTALTPALGFAASLGLVGASAFVVSTLPTNSNFANLLFTPSDLTFSPEEVRSLQECVFEDVYENPEINKFHKVVPGIVSGKQIALLGLLGMVGKSGKGCDPTSDNVSFGVSEKFWAPASNSIRLEACGKDFLDSFFVWGMNKGIKKADLTNTDFFAFVQERLAFANLEALFRIAWFADTDAADVDASPAGILTAGTDETLFNHIDGIWKQIYAIVATTAARRVTITKNAGVSYSAQEFDTTDTTNKVVSGYLQTMRFSADYRLRGKANLIYVATQSVVDQYEKELTNANVAYTTERLENGMTILKSGSIEVYGWNLWDRIIRENFDNGTTYYQPHRIVLTTTDNIQLGLEDEGAFKGVDAFYDKKSKKNFIDVEYTLDAKLVQDYLVVAAY